MNPQKQLHVFTRTEIIWPIVFANSETIRDAIKNHDVWCISPGELDIERVLFCQFFRNSSPKRKWWRITKHPARNKVCKIALFSVGSIVARASRNIRAKKLFGVLRVAPIASKAVTGGWYTGKPAHAFTSSGTLNYHNDTWQQNKARILYFYM